MVIKERKHWPISAIVYLALFYGIIILLIFMAFKGGLLPLMLLLIPIILLFYDYATRVDWDIRGLKKAKNVLFLDGTIGVAESTITPEYGGRATLMVAIKPDYCPENEWERMPKMRGALATLASRVHLQVTREKWKFIELVGEECGAPEGAILILSGADPDRKIRLIDERVFSQLEYNDSVLRKYCFADEFIGLFS